MRAAGRNRTGAPEVLSVDDPRAEEDRVAHPASACMIRWWHLPAAITLLGGTSAVAANRRCLDDMHAVTAGSPRKFPVATGVAGAEARSPDPATRRHRARIWRNG